MSDFIRDFVTKNKPQFVKYKTYIEHNDWTDITIDSSLNDEYFNNLYSEDPTKIKKSEITKLIKEQIAGQKNKIETKANEYKLQNDLISNLLNRVTYVVNKSVGDHHNSAFKSFIKFSLGIVDMHTERVDNYLASVDISKIENQEVRSDEIKLTKDCFAGITKIQQIVTDLNIKEDQAAEGIQWLDTQKATVAMHQTLVLQYPEIQTKLDAMGIDLVSSPPKTIHILNENPPIYNPDKNYWEQDKDVLQYYLWEWKKIDEGVTIDGYFIDGWLYFHFNFFVTTIPETIIKNGMEENKDKTVVPDLRDNEILITDYFLKSKKDQKMSLIAATRRVAKTTLNSSRIYRGKILNLRQILCAGGNSEDLNHIHNNLDICINNINPAFKLYYLAPTEDGRGKAYGIKTKANKSKITTQVYIINLEGGTKKGKKESLAGFTPSEFILDEAMKFPYKKQLQALESALWGIGVLRCNVLITGTGGDEDLAVDAINMLNHPEKNKVTLMDWDELERNVPPHLITWKRKKFGLFLPTQMCIKHKKIKSNLADYVGIKSETLSKVTLWVTDWETSKKAEEKERADKIDIKEDYVRLLAYHPFDPEEIFLSGKLSPFADIINEAKKHREYLLETGKWDNRRKLYKDSNGSIVSELSNEDLVVFPFTGANQDAPYNIIEPPDNVKNPRYYYVASGDFYKQIATTTTDSVCTIFIMKYPLLGDKSGGKLVASLATRPNSYGKLNDKVLLLLEYYNAIIFPENEDLAVFQTYLEGKHLEDVYLEKHIDFNGVLAYSENAARKYGWTPKQSKNKLMGMFVNYLSQPVKIENDMGLEVEVKRVQTIDDIYLLSEIISFNDVGNFDRISGILGCVGLLHFLEKNYIYPKVSFRKKEDEEETPNHNNQEKYNILQVIKDAPLSQTEDRSSFAFDNEFNKVARIANKAYFCRLGTLI